MNKVAIIGYGWVGKSMHELFPEAFIYSRNIIRHAGDWIKVTDNSWKDKEGESYKSIVNEADIAFICVPTPLMENGRLDTSIIEETLEWLNAPLIVIRSTVNPGDCLNWVRKYGKEIVFQPEYLGETPNHPLLNEVQTRFLIIGGNYPSARRKLIDLYTTVYNANVTIRQMGLLEAEIVKLSENRAIAFKVMQCQELYDACEKAGVDYYEIRDAVYGDDPRFTLFWTFIYPNSRGFNSSKCLVKDVPAWYAWCESVGADGSLTKGLIEKSNQYAKN